LRAIKGVEEQVFDVSLTLIVVGDGPLRENLVQLQKSLEIKSNVIWLGRQPISEVGRWLREADFYVSFPETEGISSSLLEAMACGCYPVVTNLPGNREWISDQVNGTLVHLNHTQISLCLIDLISKRDSLLKAVHDNRKTIEENANAELINREFVKMYRKLIQRNVRDKRDN
jgi:glycosyltransferase involved in cell wall biosynthesis